VNSYTLRFLGALAVSILLLGSVFLYLGRFSTYSQAVDMASGMMGFVDSFKVRPQVTEAEVLAFAERAVSAEDYDAPDRSLGFLNGAEVIVEHPCADVCPQATVRIIRLEVPIARTCSQVGGVERVIGLWGFTYDYCFPRILVDNWDTYRRASRIW
jgi:hypothetical protein